MTGIGRRVRVPLVVLAVVVSLAGCGGGSPSQAAGGAGGGQRPTYAPGQPVFPADTECGTFSGRGCAPPAARVDLRRPRFSDPTRVTNPLFPIGRLESAVLLGQVDGQPFRSETTLLPGTATVVVDGRPVQVLRSQYLAYLGGRITEVALDRYAQADDGSVWYLGEDVFDYDKGTIAASEGTWLAGRDGPAAMIMPGRPAVGQVFHTEDIPGVVFEEVKITQVGQTVRAAAGPVAAAVVADELHLDGSHSRKVFAPGYGEFFTASPGEVEALALAVPADRLAGPQPVELAKLLTSAWGVLESARLADWEAVASTARRIARLRLAPATRAAAPAPVAKALDRSAGAVAQAAAARKAGAVMAAAIELAQAALDLQLRYRSVAAVDVERFHLHAQRLRLDAAAGDRVGASAETATLELIRDRLTDTLARDDLGQLDDRLDQLRTSVTSGNLAAAADQAGRLAAFARSQSAP